MNTTTNVAYFPGCQPPDPPAPREQVARYYSPAETAKCIRVALRDEFPGVKFSVRTEVYSMGSSVNIRWTDGPRTKEVERVVNGFSGGGFDGMIDMAYSYDAYVKNGRVVGTRTSGTTGSRGSVPAHDDAVEDAELVHFGAKHVSCYRDFASPEVERATVEAAAEMIRSRCMVEGVGTGARFGSQWVGDLAVMMAHGRDADGSMERAFDRVVMRKGND